MYKKLLVNINYNITASFENGHAYIPEVSKSTNLLTSCTSYGSMAHQRIIVFVFCAFFSPTRELQDTILESLKLTLSSI